MANARARNLRKSMTRQEVKLWQTLRSLRPIGYHFRRQSPLSPYIVDFECRRSGLIIEIDGNQHGFDDHRKRDRIRDKELQSRGYKVLRFSNVEVDREFEGVLESIYLALNASRKPHPAASRPPSPEGEG